MKNLILINYSWCCKKYDVMLSLAYLLYIRTLKRFMEIKTVLKCPGCISTNIVKNGIKCYGKQNYLCKNCKRQFVGNHNLTYLGCHSKLIHKIELMLVRGCGIRDIAQIERVSEKKVLSILVKSSKIISPKQSYYDELEVDEFWTYVSNKTQKKWLIYAYHRKTGEIVAWVWGGRNLKTARRLRQKLKDLKITFGQINTDDWKSFTTAFKSDNNVVGKKHTVGIEGNNCRLRHRIKRAVRKTCCFSKKLFNHLKAFELAIFYINYGYI